MASKGDLWNRPRQKRLLIAATVARTIKAFLFPYADYFRSTGWRVDALANGVGDCRECCLHFEEVHDIQWSRSPFELRNLAAGLRTVRRVCNSGAYDIVHVHTPIASFVTRMALRRSMCAPRPAVVYTAHGFHFHQNASSAKNIAFKTLERIAGNWTDFLITINRTDECEALKAGIVDRDRLIMMPGIGVDLEHFSPDCVSRESVEAIRCRLRIPPDTPVFVMIAEFIPRKRHTDAIRAMAAMHNRRAHLVLIGDGPLLGSITALVVKNNLESRVHIAGQQQDVRPFIAAARATVLPSSQEGLPRSVMESLSCGIPAIGSNIRGTRDLVNSGGGVAFEPGNIGELAGLLDWFADHPREAAAMGEQGRRSMAEYGISRLLRMHEQLYARAMRHRG